MGRWGENSQFRSLEKMALVATVRPFCRADQGVQGVYLTEVEAQCAGPTSK